MYFQISEEISQIDIEDINPQVLTLGIISLEDLEQHHMELGFSEITVNDCKNENHHNHGSLEAYDNYLFGIIYGINAKQLIKVQDRLAIYIKRNLLLIVIIEDRDDSVRTKLSQMMEHLNVRNINQERLIYGFLERLISEDYELLEKIEEDISEHEDRINEGNPDKDFNLQISYIRKKLLVLNNYYQQLMALGDELETNSIDLFNEENVHYFGKYSDRVSRLSGNARMLQEYCVQVREAYHAHLEYDQNNIMKMFTVVTTIFLPLTLIVGWYGMNFTTMPELTWRYGYLCLILISLAVFAFCIIYFKKKKFM